MGDFGLRNGVSGNEYGEQQTEKSRTGFSVTFMFFASILREGIKFFNTGINFLGAGKILWFKKTLIPLPRSNRANL